MTPRLRFAPSPNGPLHLGHALSALANEAVARREEGELLLRIEDIDMSRARPEHVEAIETDLAWLGLSWSAPATRQSTRMDAYRTALDRLDAQGLLYPCYATRGEIRAASGENARRDPDGAPLYPGLHKNLSAAHRVRLEAEGRQPALRLDMARALAAATPGGTPLAWDEDGAGPAGETGRIAADPASWGDVVVARRDVPTSYHLAVVVDDAAQGITHVVRGRDLFHATSVHRLLQTLLGLDPPRYLHHRLILDNAGTKLSKSAGAPRLGALREAGVAAATLRDMLLAEPLAGRNGPAPLTPSAATARA